MLDRPTFSFFLGEAMASSSSPVMGLLALIAASLLSSAAGGSSPAPPPQEPHQAFLLAPILSNLGFQELAMAVPAIYSPVLSAWSGPLTLFVPSDDTLHSCPSCSPLRLLREHLVPGLFSLPYLSKLPFGTKLETASPGRCLTVTSSAAAAIRPGSTANSSDVKIFVDGVEVTRPDLFNDGRFVIHGIGGFVAPLSPLSCSHGDPHPAFAPDIAAAGASDCPASAIVRLMLRDAVARLRDSGFSILALAMRVKHAELAGLQNMTVFALDDPSIFAGGHGYVAEVRFHVVPNRLLTHADLMRLPPGAILPTLVRGQHLVVTHAAVVAVGPASGLRINYVPIKVPDVVTNARIVVHSIFLPFPHIYLPVPPSAAAAAEGGIYGGPFGVSVECELATEVVDFMDDGP